MSILTKNAHTNNYLTDEYKNDAILRTNRLKNVPGRTEIHLDIIFSLIGRTPGEGVKMRYK